MSRSSARLRVFAIALLVACTAGAPAERGADFHASYSSGNGYAGHHRSGEVQADGTAIFEQHSVGATLEIRSTLTPTDLDALYAELRQQELQTVVESKRAELQHDASQEHLDVRSGEWSISLGENGGKELTQNAARFAAAGSHIMGAVTGKPEGTAVQVVLEGKPFADDVHIVIRVPGPPPGVVQSEDRDARTWTLYFADPSMTIEATPAKATAPKVSFAPAEHTLLHAGVDASGVTLGVR